MESKLSHLETKVVDVESACSYMNTDIESQRNSMKETKTEIKPLIQDYDLMMKASSHFRMERDNHGIVN